MRKPSSSRETIRARYFVWLLYRREGIYYADGRGNQPSVGRRSLGSSHRSEALQNLEQLDFQMALRAGKVPATERHERDQDAAGLSLAEGIAAYKVHATRPQVAKGVRPSTWTRYQSVFNSFLAFAPTIGVTNWNAVSKATLDRYAAHLVSRDRKPRTQAFALITVKQAHHWLIEEGHVPKSRGFRYPVCRPTESDAHCWTQDQFQAIVKLCWSRSELHWLGEVCFALGMTGMRISELANLRWSDIDLASRAIRLTDESRSSRVPAAERRTLKTGRGREIPIHADLHSRLSALSCHRDGFVFRNGAGGRISVVETRQTLVRDVITPLAARFTESSEDDGFKHGRLHTFRHFFCSSCANSGIPELTVMKWLGHTKPSMTRRYYHLAQDESRKQMDRLSIPDVTAATPASEPLPRGDANPPTS